VSSATRLSARDNLYQWSKYLIYALLSSNILFFFGDEWLAAEHTLVSDWVLPDLIEAFAATIDTLAWVLLLLMFELETWHLNPAVMKRSTKHALMLIRAVCYLMIISAFFGYTEKMLELESADLVAAGPACDLGAEGYKQMITLDEYEAIDAAACREQVDLAVHEGQKWIASTQVLEDTKALAWVDVLNAGTWLLIVALLELDLRAAAKGSVSKRGALVSNGLKLVLYVMLVIFAIYWGLNGAFIDFWDAFLWILAFVYIERNLFTSWEAVDPDSAPAT
jgi:hypothetical protein